MWPWMSPVCVFDEQTKPNARVSGVSLSVTTRRSSADRHRSGPVVTRRRSSRWPLITRNRHSRSMFGGLGGALSQRGLNKNPFASSGTVSRLEYSRSVSDCACATDAVTPTEAATISKIRISKTNDSVRLLGVGFSPDLGGLTFLHLDQPVFPPLLKPLWMPCVYRHDPIGANLFDDLLQRRPIRVSRRVVRPLLGAGQTAHAFQSKVIEPVAQPLRVDLLLLGSLTSSGFAVMLERSPGTQLQNSRSCSIAAASAGSVSAT